MADSGSGGAAPPSGPDGSPAPAPAEPARPYYSLANIAGSARDADVFTLDSLQRSAESVYHSRCFRTAFLWAGALGVLFAAHRFKQGGSMRRVTGDGALAWMLTFGSQWYLCRADDVDRRVALKAFYMQQSRKTSGANAPREEDADPGLAPDEAVSRELARVSRYDLPDVRPGPSQGVQMR